jgi:hypothetical protein
LALNVRKLKEGQKLERNMDFGNHGRRDMGSPWLDGSRRCKTHHRSEGKDYVNHIKRRHLGMTGSLKKWIIGAFPHPSIGLTLNSASQIEQDEN